MPWDELNTLQGLYPCSRLHIGEEDEIKRSRSFVTSWYEKLAEAWRGYGVWHPWAAFFSTEAICSFHVKLESIMVPKYLIELTCSNGTLLHFMLRVIGGLWVLNKIIFVLHRYSENVFFCNQLNTVFNSVLAVFHQIGRIVIRKK